MHVVRLLEGIQFFTKHEKMLPGKNPYIQSTVNPSSGGNHVNVCSQDFNNGLMIPIIKEFIMQRNLRNMSVENPSGGIQA